MTYVEKERRRHPRIDARFIVSYRILEEEDNVDISQTKNMSLAGMLLTTNRQFESGIHLVLEIRLPFDPDPILLVGKVMGSREITKNLIYDTRIQFLAIDNKHKDIVIQTVDYYLNRGRK